MKAPDAASLSQRTPAVQSAEIIVVGAGQAGLSIGYWLRKLPRPFLLLEAGARIGNSWRERYDSLILFTPRRYDSLPGPPLPGDPDAHPTKDEMADYLETYARHFALPIHMNTKVECMHKQGETFVLQT